MMINIYADYNFYKSTYLGEKEGIILETDFDKLAREASIKIQEVTLGKSDYYNDDDKVKLCMCELAEITQTFNELDNEMNLILSSEKVGEYSRSFRSVGQLSADKEFAQYKIFTKYLALTGMLYRGQ